MDNEILRNFEGKNLGLVHGILEELLQVSSELCFLIPYFTLYIDINCFPLRQMCFIGHLICKDTN